MGKNDSKMYISYNKWVNFPYFRQKTWDFPANYICLPVTWLHLLPRTGEWKLWILAAGRVNQQPQVKDDTSGSIPQTGREFVMGNLKKTPPMPRFPKEI